MCILINYDTHTCSVRGVQLINQFFFFYFCSASVAKKLHEECFALIFGINTLIALILQSLLTFIVITKYNLMLRTQYQIYSYVFFALALIYGVTGVAKFVYKQKKAYQLNSVKCQI